MAQNSSWTSNLWSASSNVDGSSVTHRHPAVKVLRPGVVALIMESRDLICSLPPRPSWVKLSLRADATMTSKSVLTHNDTRPVCNLQRVKGSPWLAVTGLTQLKCTNWLTGWAWNNNVAHGGHEVGPGTAGRIESSPVPEISGTADLVHIIGDGRCVLARRENEVAARL